MENEINKEISIEEINGVKAEIKVQTPVHADLTETINQAYKDGLQSTVQKTGKGLAFCFQFLASKIKPYMYEQIQEAEYKCREIDRKLEEKYNKIPEENQTFPRTSILGPSLDVLKYNLDEDYIKDAFINLLSHEMDSRFQTRVLPSYISIVNQLSTDDAQFLKLFKDNNSTEFRSILLTVSEEKQKGINQLEKYILITRDLSQIPTIYHTQKLNNLIIDNLLRLKLIEVSYSEWYTENLSLYDKLFNLVSSNYSLPQNKMLAYKKGYVRLSQFGKNFIDICLS